MQNSLSFGSVMKKVSQKVVKLFSSYQFGSVMKKEQARKLLSYVPCIILGVL